MLPDPIVLAFDTSAAHFAAALVQGDTVRGFVREDMAKGQAERLFPLLEELLTKAETDWSDLSAIGVCTGPGNFTGVRISVSSARGLALSLNVPAIGVSMLEALAFGQSGNTTSLVDARRGRVFAQRFANGAALNDPEQRDIPELDSSTFVSADPIDGLEIASPKMAAVEAIARIAATRIGKDNPRPAPLYLRAADAALPADPPPVILP